MELKITGGGSKGQTYVQELERARYRTVPLTLCGDQDTMNKDWSALQGQLEARPLLSSNGVAGCFGGQWLATAVLDVLETGTTVYQETRTVLPPTRDTWCSAAYPLSTPTPCATAFVAAAFPDRCKFGVHRQQRRQNL